MPSPLLLKFSLATGFNPPAHAPAPVIFAPVSSPMPRKRSRRVRRVLTVGRTRARARVCPCSISVCLVGVRAEYHLHTLVACLLQLFFCCQYTTCYS